MTTFVRQSRTIAKVIDAGRKTGGADIEGITPAEIHANLLRSFDEFTASISTTKSQSLVKGSRGANHKKEYFGR